MDTALGEPGWPVTAQHLHARILDGSACVGVIGLGYVGLPLALSFAERGLSVLGFDIDPDKPAALKRGESYIHHIRPDRVAALIETGRFDASADFSRLGEADAILICVPTPLSAHQEPNLDFVTATAHSVLSAARPGQLIVLESTTYPGTTRDILNPLFRDAGWRVGQDLFLAYSPEREDPGNPSHDTTSIPKVVGADDPASRRLVEALYARLVDRVVPVSSAATAEAVKLTENVFRAVNIALVNELKLIYERMGIDVWEVIEAAKTKPFGYMAFYPGPGLGGHCIPIDPFYLSWKAREYEISTRFIELAGQINVAMPGHVVTRLADQLDARFGKALRGAKIVLLGAAYKRNVDDIRESPALRIMHLLSQRRANVSYHDPFIARIPTTRDYPEFAGLVSLDWDAVLNGGFDAALICTDHDGYDIEALVRALPLVVDTRNATASLPDHLRDNVVKA